MPITERSIRAETGPPVEPHLHLGAAADDQSPLQERQHYDEFRAIPAVVPFLPGGAEFESLSRRFRLPRTPEAVAAYERSLFGYLSARWMPLSHDVLARISEVSACESVRAPLRRETKFVMDYAALESANDRDLRAAMTVEPNPAFDIAWNKKFIVFTKAGLVEAEQKGAARVKLRYRNDKVHLNVNRVDLPLAWKVLRPLLLSEDNPFPLWKLASYRKIEDWHRRSLHRIDESPDDDATPRSKASKRAQLHRMASRHRDGAQITLYAHRVDNDPAYMRQKGRIRRFLAALDWELSTSGVQPGVVPVSDVTLDGLDFLTYRNDRVGTRGEDYGEKPITPKMKDELRATRFYRAIERSPPSADRAPLPRR